MAYIKKVIFAVAGSGKTSSIIRSLNLTQRFLIITYTTNNVQNVKSKIVEKFGFIPGNIVVHTYFSFLFNFCIRPFAIDGCDHIERLDFDINNVPRYEKGISRYVSKGNSLYHSRAFDFVNKFIGYGRVIARIEKFFDFVFLDEVQDFAGYDFDFVTMLGKVNINVMLFGDFFQHTFDTSRSGAKNSSLHNDYNNYKMHFENFFSVDESSLAVSYRCSNEICEFIRDRIKIKICSYRRTNTSSKPVLIQNKKEILCIMDNPSIKKLFYKCSESYLCNASNWGDCKGLTFDDVCVVLNENTYKLFCLGNLDSLPPISKNKFYVACTRASGRLFFVREKDVAEYKTK